MPCVPIFIASENKIHDNTFDYFLANGRLPHVQII